MRARDERGESRPVHAALLPQRVPRPRGREALPRGGVQGAHHVQHHRRALHRLQGKPEGPQLLVTTINALLQRTLTPFRIREWVRLLKPKLEIGRESLIALLQRQGYSPATTGDDALYVADAAAGTYVPLTEAALARLGLAPFEESPHAP